MPSQYELDCQRISQISFDPDLDDKTRCIVIARIERRMERMEQKEIDGVNTGYYS